MSLSSPSCRILVVSASLDHALAFIQRTRGKKAEVADGATIPWTITNKYYSADVHFAAHTVHELSPDLLKGIPAVVFVWARGEAYRDHVDRLAQDMQGCEPEVSLAVRIHAAESTTASREEEEEEGEVDEFLSSYGFEYVNVTDDEDEDDGKQLLDGVPDFPRVIDALSTIMWPSMVGRERASFNWVQGGGHVEDEDEMTELARWLEKSELGGEDPWTSPGLADEEVKMGFEDDFMVPESGWTSLGSDFESDEELPTRAEVEAARSRIFGGSDVFGRLEEMKAEIAAVGDEEERRRAAAAVALGVAYGL